jgi:pimeloyl-ACP methyl ester carboxylesterase
LTTAATHQLERPDAAIAYRSVGEGPPLILLHATLSSSRQLRRLAELLAQRFSVISVDRRGSGKSPWPTGAPLAPIDVASHIADVEALCHELGISEAVLVGHSYGGCIALELAARRPGLVRAVWAYEPPYAAVGSPSTRATMEAVASATEAAAQRGGGAAAAEAFMSGVSGDEAVAALSPGARRRVQEAGSGAIADAALLGMEPAGLGSIECPVRIVTGELSAAHYQEIAAALVERIPSATTESIPAADHMAPLLRPELVAASIEGFTTA